MAWFIFKFFIVKYHTYFIVMKLCIFLKLYLMLFYIKFAMRERRINSVRSDLLEEAHKELQMKKGNKNETMINSKKLEEYEKELEVKMIVSLKSQMFFASPGKFTICLPNHISSKLIIGN